MKVVKSKLHTGKRHEPYPADCKKEQEHPRVTQAKRRIADLTAEKDKLTVALQSMSVPIHPEQVRIRVNLETRLRGCLADIERQHKEVAFYSAIGWADHHMPTKAMPLATGDLQLDDESRRAHKSAASIRRATVRTATVNYDADVCPVCHSSFRMMPDSSLSCSNRGCGTSIEYIAPVQSALPYGEEQEYAQHRVTEQKKSYRKFLMPYIEGAPDPPPELLRDVKRELANYHIRSTWTIRETFVKNILVHLSTVNDATRTYNPAEWKNHARKICRILKGDFVPILPRDVAADLVKKNTEHQRDWHAFKNKRTNCIPKSTFTNRTLLLMGFPKEAASFDLSKSKNVFYEQQQLMEALREAKMKQKR